MYGLDELRSDAEGYGRVVYLGKEGSIVQASPEWSATEPFLQRKAADTFLNSIYALVKTSLNLKIYRFYGVDPSAEALILGTYWSPSRPSLAIDQLGYPSFHNTSRASLAMKNDWNPMSQVAEANLAAGAWAFVGRAAPQQDGPSLLGGGAIQFILPAPGHRLHLTQGLRTS